MRAQEQLDLVHSTSVWKVAELTTYDGSVALHFSTLYTVWLK